jgi:tripartite-type tricarboxylate transporter receptor subunit TctC
MTTRRTFLVSMASLAGMTVAGAARAQTWPSAPVKILVPYAAGGNTDGIARLVAQFLSTTFGQNFIVENRTGANGVLAAEAVARAAPDGYTLFMATLPQIAIFPAMTKTSYDPVKDFVPVVNLASNPFLLVANREFPAKTLPDLVNYVRARPATIVYASGGTGSISHLTMVLMLKRAGLDMLHTPYRGGAPAIADTIAGHVPLYFGNLSEGLPHVQSGQLRAVAVSGAQRVAQLPDVPTVAEAGFAGFNTTTWNGLLAPAKTPGEIIDKIAKAAQQALREPVLLERFSEYGVEAVGSAPDKFSETIKADIARWADAVQIAGVRL